MNYRFCFAVLGAGLCALTGTAHAQSDNRATVQAIVKLDDLNLNHPSGIRTANDRIESAARKACSRGDDGRLTSKADVDLCKDQVRASGAANVARVQEENRIAEQRRLAYERAQVQRQARARAAAAKPAAKRYRHCYWSKRVNKRVCVWRVRRR